MFQLQSRVWGWEEDGRAPEGNNPYASAFSMPTTAPDNENIWEELVCDVEGAGKRDVGAGNIIYYRVLDANQTQTWARDEKEYVHIQRHDINEFLSGIVPYLSWWNVKSRYAPEMRKSMYTFSATISMN